MELGMQSHGLGRGWEGLDGAGNGIPWLGGGCGRNETKLGMGSDGITAGNGI